MKRLMALLCLYTTLTIGIWTHGFFLPAEVVHLKSTIECMQAFPDWTPPLFAGESQPLDASASMQLGGPLSPDGTVEVTIDFPLSQRHHNSVGTDGSGLCVWTSCLHSALWQNERSLFDIQKKMEHEIGGGYPSKVDFMFKKYAKGVRYIQYQGKDLSILKAALKTGRMPGVTYNGRDPHYPGQWISHMVNLVHLDEKWACILDNNYIGEKQLVWMSPADFMDRWVDPPSRWIPNPQGWAVILLKGPPPPIPHK